MAEYDLISKRSLLCHLDMAIDCKNCPRNVDRITYYDRCACSEVSDICSIITDFATLEDVVAVVHCKDCKYREEHHYEEEREQPYIKYSCKFTQYSMPDDGYCSCGVRKKEA